MGDRGPLRRPAARASRRPAPSSSRDVAPYELMKLRLLNGSHSTLAYLGYLAGYETVADAMADPAFARLVRGADGRGGRRRPCRCRRAPTSPPTSGRCSSASPIPALKHRTWQIAMDGSPEAAAAPARHDPRPARRRRADRRASRSASPPGCATSPAVDEGGKPIDVRDPLAERLRRIADAAGPVAERLAPAFLGIRDDLRRRPRRRPALRRAGDAGPRRPYRGRRQEDGAPPAMILPSALAGRAELGPTGPAFGRPDGRLRPSGVGARA